VGRSIFLEVQPCPYHTVTPQCSPVLGFPSIYAYTLDAELPNLMWQHIRRGFLLGGQYASTPTGCLCARHFWGFLSIHAYTLCHRTTKFDVTHGEGTCFSGVSHDPTPRGQGLGIPHVLGFLSIHAYTLCCRTTEFDMVTHTGSGLVFRGQPHPTPRVRCPNSPQFLGYLLFMHTPFVTELPNLTW